MLDLQLLEQPRQPQGYTQAPAIKTEPALTFVQPIAVPQVQYCHLLKVLKIMALEIFNTNVAHQIIVVLIRGI